MTQSNVDMMTPLFNIYSCRRFRFAVLVMAFALWTLFSFDGNANQTYPSMYGATSGEQHQVFIAFGFHVNLYHSFRNDTNDESGFGKDIRIIRHIIRTLDRYNALGVPVRGVWDFDNLFSLQELLPQYAPDIIESIKRRVHENGDEVILMSYNNGLVSAMTEQELNDAVRWSISNPWQSGVKDIFGTYSPIVRPQEMMTTPGNFSIYKNHGIEAVSLYYSATPFDTFRVFSRPLTRAEAHNPILYRHPRTKEEMVVIPTYHIGDLVEHVSLSNWVSELRSLQNNGQLNHDALLFINYDADSELWSGIDLPWILEWLPNTDGLGALINEAKNLSGVRFTTLGNYLAQHKPVGTFYFSQDTADGSYNGYNSWSEKADASRQWTTIERNRKLCAAARKAKALFKEGVSANKLDNLVTFARMTRLRALSTTHFGMATPFVARQREQAMADLMLDLDRYSDQIQQLLTEELQPGLKNSKPPEQSHARLTWLDTVMVLTTSRGGQGWGNRFVKFTVPAEYPNGASFVLLDDQGRILPSINLGFQPAAAHQGEIMLFITGAQGLTDGRYHLFADSASSRPRMNDTQTDIIDNAELSNGRVSVRLNSDGIAGIYLDGIRQTDAGSLMPSVKWGDQTYRSRAIISQLSPATTGSPPAIRLTGPLPGPKVLTLSNGWMDYRYILVPDSPYLLLQGHLVYPSTEKRDILKAASPGLIRRADLNWVQAAPAEIRFSPKTVKNDPIRILKRNYLGVSTQYALDYFRYSDQNLNLDNINNHITESYVGIVAGNHGMAIAMDTSVQSNFAFAPLQMHYQRQDQSFTIRANPFGTYFGHQYRPPTWGNGNGFDITLLTGEQFAGAGPTYNGATQDFSLMLAFFNSCEMPEGIRNDLIDYAHPPVVISSHEVPNSIRPQPLAPPRGFVAAYKRGTVQFGWDNDTHPEYHFRILCGQRPGSYEAVYPATGNSLEINHFTEDQAFIKGQQYYAVIERVSANGRTSSRTPEIRFAIGETKEKRPEIPLKVELKVLWANLQVLVASLRL